MFTHFLRALRWQRRRPRTAASVRRLRLEPLEGRQLLAPLADIVNVQPDPRTNPVGQVFVNFRDSDTGLATNVTGVDINDFRLTRNSEPVSLAGLVVSGSGDNYSLDLSSVTLLDGTYVLTLMANGSEIRDSNLGLLTQDALDDFQIDAAGPSANIVDVSPDPRNTAVGNVSIIFDEPVTGVTIDDFTLRRGSSVVDLNGLTVTGGGANWAINLSTVTGASGTYVLTLNATDSEIRDSVGNPLTASASDTWASDASAPEADIIDIAPDPRTTAVGSVSIMFTENVSGVDIGDFSLTRNGTVVSLAGLTLTGSGNLYGLNLATVTAAAGTYVLTINAAGSGISDGLGNPIVLSASDTWVNDTTAPTADIVDITPDPRTTPVGAVTINFSEPVTGVDTSDFRLTRNGTDVPLTGLTVGGSGMAYTIDLSTVTTTFGAYVLTLVASGSGIVDAVGNPLAANASDSWSSDDALEQNDTLTAARELGRLSGTVILNSLGLVDANDWFRFTTSATGTASSKVTLTFNNAQGNLDLQLYNVAGQRLKSSTGNGNSETVSLSGLKAGTYYIRVFGRNGAINPSYSLTINAPGAALKTSASATSMSATDAVFASWLPTTARKSVARR